MVKRTCCWVLEPWHDDKPAVYCGKPTKYRVVDGVRVYDAFCENHVQMANGSHDEDEDEWTEVDA